MAKIGRKVKGLSGHPLRRQIEIWKPRPISMPKKVAGLVGVTPPKGSMGGYSNPASEGKARPRGAGY